MLKVFQNFIQSMKQNRRLTLATLSGCTAFIAMLALSFTDIYSSAPEYVIVVDPGHGGITKNVKDDKWDALSKKYIQHYAPGTRHGRHTEQGQVLKLGKRVKRYLDLTRSPRGWKEFRKLLRKFSPESNFQRIRFKTHLTRNNSWKQRGLRRDALNLNAPYRLYDYPHHRTGRIQPGRISRINKLKPYLVLSLHLNPAGRGHDGGMAAVLAPGYKTFNMLREITLKKKPASRFESSPWAKNWLATDAGWSRFESARADAWVYFHGYRSLRNGRSPWMQKYRGYRHNMVNWIYRAPGNWARKARLHKPGPYSLKYNEFKAVGKFWDRERGAAEQWRREGGPLKYGGDNHFASDELLRYIQYGTRRIVKKRRKARAMGKILDPFISTYSLPTFVNAICAYLEVGHINRNRDLTLMTRDSEAVAQSLAVGIYSLFQGIKLRKGYGPYRPKGKKLNFERYGKLKNGNYFKIVTK